ncbi:polyprenyl diphosphate synthase [Brevibacterium litoralis]|uniref:polyprenyl diphosphate synthase n=1 Tax=Brevibacterium litoralis TaxID=3138935 RepID=UPI0032EBC292
MTGEPVRRSALSWLYRLYDRRITKNLGPSDRIPCHVGVITDGNRRWAKDFGATTADGHRAGAAKIVEFLGWCEEIGVQIVTLYVLSKENLARSEAEVGALTEIISEMVERIADKRSVSLSLAGDLEVIPEPLRSRLQAAEDRSAAGDAAAKKLRVNVAVGYSGRQEIVDAVKSYLRTRAAEGADLTQVLEDFTEDSVSEHLYIKGQPDPDLIIRTSGEQRLSGFLVWQSAYSEFYFCEVYWPGFRRTDFLRAVRSYAQRNRRYGK